MYTTGLKSRNKIQISAKQRFSQSGKMKRTTDFLYITINGKKIRIDDLDIFEGDKPYIRIYGDIEFVE